MSNRTIVFLNGHALRQSVHFYWNVPFYYDKIYKYLPIDRLSSASGICFLLATYICVPTRGIVYTGKMYYQYLFSPIVFAISVLMTFCVESIRFRISLFIHNCRRNKLYLFQERKYWLVISRFVPMTFAYLGSVLAVIVW
jgi:hypothetical protein